MWQESYRVVTTDFSTASAPYSFTMTIGPESEGKSVPNVIAFAFAVVFESERKSFDVVFELREGNTEPQK